MPAARLWRITGIDAWGGGALELSALHLYGSAGRLDATATLGCSHPPASGTLAALQDADPETLCTFAAAPVRAPGFWLQWDFGAGNTADVWGLRVGAGTSKDLFLSTCFLQYFDGSAWVAAPCGAYPWPGAGGLTAAPSGPVAFGGEVGFFIERTAAGSRNWYSAAMSAYGLRIVAGVNGGYLYTSSDGGATWAERTAVGSRNWNSAAMSADGLRIVAGVNGGYLYTSTLRASDAIEPTLRTTTRATAPVFTRATGGLRTLGGQRQQLARDTAHGGSGTVYGTVDRKGTPANVPLRRRVRLHSDASGALVRETWSDAATGAFAFTGIDPAQRYTTLAYDHEHNFRAEAADNLTPEVSP